MGGGAADAEIVELLADLFGVIGRPVVVGGEELDILVAHFGDSADSPHEVVFQLVANGVQFQSNWYVFGSRGRERGGGGQGEQRAAGQIAA